MRMSPCLHVLVSVLFQAALCTNPGCLVAPPDEDVEVQARLDFEKDLDKVLESASRVRKPVIIVFQAVWCPYCRTMNEVTFTSPMVLGVADRFHWVVLDLDRDISPARKYGVTAAPTTVLLDSSGRTCKKLIGGFSPKQFVAAIDIPLSSLEQEDPDSPHVTEVYGDISFTPLTYKPEGYRGDSTCFSNVGYGPLTLHSQSPFQSLRLGIVPRPPSTLAEGQYEFRTTATWVNIWAYEKMKYRLDYEMLQWTTSFFYGFSDTFQIEVDLEDRSRFGGIMDGFIQGFHDATNLSQSGRDRFPKGDFAFDIEGVSLTKGDRGHYRQSLSLTLQHNVTCGTERLPAIAYALTSRFKLNDAGDIQSDGLVDLGASVSMAHRYDDYYLYFMLGYAYFGKERFYGLDLKESQISSCVAAEWRFAPTQSLFLQYLFSEGVVKGLRPFSKPSNEVTLGWKGEVAQDVVLEFGLIENIITHDNSPDFGLHAGLSIRF